jgi:hypothetical protein
MRERGKGKPARPILPTSPVYLLDHYKDGDIRHLREQTRKLLALHWKYYTELAFQRYEARYEIQAALIEAASEGFEFRGWQRVVPWRWTLAPLSSAGSLNDPGGRFNFGAIDPRFETFPAFYLAEDKIVGQQEVLGQDPSHATKLRGVELTALELALARRDSITCISVSGRLESYIDLRKPDRLKKFVELIADFSLSAGLKQDALKLGLPPLTVMTKLEQLMDELLRGDWRHYPSQVDVPSNSQIFGQLVFHAGIDGIVFPSKFGGGKLNLALYPTLLGDSDTFVQVDDVEPNPPNPKVVRRLDRSTWAQLSQLGG